MLVHEIFQSIQGESTYAGLPCTFIRLTGCNLRCRWCDTQYAYRGGEKMTIETAVARITAYPHQLVEITGGEPLCQPETTDLCLKLLDKGYTVLVETNGTLDINLLPWHAIRIMDIKCPSSGHEGDMLWDNIHQLTAHDQIKFVIADQLDFEYAVKVVHRYRLDELCPLLISPVHGKMDLAQVVEWILASHLPLRLQLQIHKVIGIK